MARELRVNDASYKDRNKIWKRVEGTNHRGESASGVFYSKDIIPLTLVTQRIGNKVIGQRWEVTIETMDNLQGLEADDWVEYGGEFYRVDKIVANDDSANKQKSKRPITKSTITLVSGK